MSTIVGAGTGAVIFYRKRTPGRTGVVCPACYSWSIQQETLNE
jgi:hypothetical protein